VAETSALALLRAIVPSQAIAGTIRKRKSPDQGQETEETLKRRKRESRPDQGRESEETLKRRRKSRDQEIEKMTGR